MRADGVSGLAPLFAAGTALGLGDAELLSRFLAGDSAAFEAIIRRHGPMVLGVGRRVLRDPNDAEDVFQATFALLATRAGSIRRRTSLAAWLHGVARRLATGVRVGGRRRRVRERVWALAVARATGVVPPLGGGDDDWRPALDAELARLPERLRAPVVLCDLEGVTHEAAALALRCPVGTVKSRLHRGRHRLRSRLARLGLDPRASSNAPLLLVPEPVAPLTEAAVRRAVREATTVAIARRVPIAFRPSSGRLRIMPVGSSLRWGVLSLLSVGLLGAGVWTWRPRPGASSPAPEAGVAQAPVPADRVGLPDQPRLVPEAAPVEKYRLPNGLTVILRPVAGAEDAALVVVYDIGTDHDPAGQSGLAHLVEHLYLTAAAGPTPARTTDELVNRYPKGMNGQTGDRYTLFAAVFPGADLDAELTDAAARMGGALRIEGADLNRERPRLVEEVGNMLADFAPLAAQNNARELVRPTPNAGRRGGTPEAVGQLTVSQIDRQISQFYRPRNAILALAGKFDPAQARAAVAARFGPLAPGEPVPPPSDPGPAAVGTTREVVTTAGEPGDLPTVALAYLAPRPDDPLYAPFLVLTDRLWARASQLDDPGEGFLFPVYFTPLDDGAVIAFTSRGKPGESTAAAVQRIEAFVAQTIAPPLGPLEAKRAADGQIGALFGTIPPPDTAPGANKTSMALALAQKLLGTTPQPDSALAANPYGVAFALARRQQLGIEPKRFDAALRGVTAATFQQASERFLAPTRHAVAVVRRAASP